MADGRLASFYFACKHVKSNSIVSCQKRDGNMLGVGTDGVILILQRIFIGGWYDGVAMPYLVLFFFLG